MPLLSSQFEQSYEATPETIGVVRTALTRFATAAGAPGSTVERIRLAVSEAVTNAVVHGYHEHTGAIHIVARLDEDSIAIAVADDGRGMHSGGASSGLGLGLSVIAEVSDSMTVVPRPSGGTELQMSFRVTWAAAASALDGVRSQRQARSGPGSRSVLRRCAAPWPHAAAAYSASSARA